MIPRHLSSILLKAAKQYPILSLVGPRQSGKTTLAKALFPKHRYISLESLDHRERAVTDPRGFLSDMGNQLILDEVQRVPELFSYLQEQVDEVSSPGQYILTGSSQFLLMEQISQSLAGRIANFKLYPLSFSELFRYPADTSSPFITSHLKRPIVKQHDLYDLLLNGLYPRIYDQHLESQMWYENYITTYVERDVRLLLNVQNLRAFEQFLKLCAAQSGQLLNYTSLSNALGQSVPTIKRWISILETSGIIFILPPFFNNLSKRVVKTPKLYFVDTGLLCSLLSIRETSQLQSHPLLGSIFETFIVSECYKRFFNCGRVPPLYFWRDQSGQEIDLLIDQGASAFPIEIKLSQTYHSDFGKPIEHWLKLAGNLAKKGAILYCGDHPLQTHSPVSVLPWSLI